MTKSKEKTVKSILRLLNGFSYEESTDIVLQVWDGAKRLSRLSYSPKTIKGQDSSPV